jgi:hypothetical protein
MPGQQQQQQHWSSLLELQVASVGCGAGCGAGMSECDSTTA